MKDIFSDLYDRVLSFFTTQQVEDETKLLAKNRLKTVLMQDRVGFSERAMQMLKDDMLETISKYLEIDTEAFDLSIDAGDETTTLNLSIPVLRTKTDEEIDEAIANEQKEKIEKTQEIVGELQELVKEKAQELAQKMDEEETLEEAEADDKKESDEVEEETENEIVEVEKELEEEVVQEEEKETKKSQESKKSQKRINKINKI